MRISDEALEEVRTRGFAVVEGFLSPDEIAAARAGMFLEFPTPEEYFADPAAHEQLVASHFAGVKLPPYRSVELTRVAFHPDLVDAAERFCGTTDVELYKIELWAKFGGSVDYDQPHHRDYGNHTLLVPRADGRWPQLTTFILLSDVDEGCGYSRPLVPARLPMGDMVDEEVSITGRAGTIFMYTTDVLHRGSAITDPHASRYVLLADYAARGNPWMGKIAWPDHANHKGWRELMSAATVRERELFGFPPPGHEYWNDQTVTDVGLRYPDMDMTPYRDGLSDG
jgi:hypothetical protein